MNPNQDPLQPQNIPPVPEPTPPAYEAPAPNAIPPIESPTPQPFGVPVAPPASFAGDNPVTPTPPPVAPPTGFGSGPMGTPGDSASIPDVAPKRGLNKKLLIIIGAVIVVLAIVAVVLLVIKPGSSTKGGVLGVIQSTVSPASQLSEYKGTNFSISYPKDFKPVDISSIIASAGPGTEGVRYSSDGTATSDGTISTVGAVSTPYTGSVTRAQEIQTFESSTSTKTPDSATNKDTVITQTTYQGVEAFKETSTTLKNGSVISKSSTIFVFGNKNFYTVSVNVATADTSTIGAEVDAILASFKINE